jgi:hydroxyethylthiazole kinase
MVKQMQQGLIVRMRYDRGQCQLTTYHLTGELIGNQNEDTDFEYNLYTTATRRYPACPSAGYELLRFGRILGPDALQPANAAHWRRISLPPRTETGEAERHAWFNLNAPGVTRFSDADFPHWMGWRLIDDDRASDSHCQSTYIRDLLEPPSLYAVQLPRREDAVSRAQSDAYKSMPEGDKRRLSEQYMDDRLRNTTYLVDATARGTLKRLICKFPTEWSNEDFNTRYGWLTKVAEGGPMSEDDFKELEKHQKALAFWEDAKLEKISNIHWHLPPVDFIAKARSCHWYSQEEIKKIYPGAPAAKITTLKSHINQTISKYLITNHLRIAHFFGQAGIETNQLVWMAELYSGDPFNYFRRYEKAKNFSGWLGNIKWNDGGNFRGRGLKQLTGRDNYAKYWTYRGWITPESFSDLWWKNPKWWGIAGSTVSTAQYSNLPIQDAEILSQLDAQMRPPVIENPDRVSQEPRTSVDTAGWFWTKNMLIAIADADNSAEMTRKIRGDGANVGVSIPWPPAANFPQRDALTKRILRTIGDSHE